MCSSSRIRTFLSLFSIILVFSGDALPYGVLTHSAISLNAYNAAFSTIQANFFNALQMDPQHTFGPQPPQDYGPAGPFTAQGWVIAGSQDEDNAPLPLSSGYARSLLHFFDPIADYGLTVADGAFAASPSRDWAILGTASISALGLNFTPVNDFPYSSQDPMIGARNHFFNGLTEFDPNDRDQELGLMFRSLGQVIHLIQDAAQPQHVRNDAHLDLSDSPAAFLPFQRPSAYERYVDGNANLRTLPGTGTVVSFASPQDFFATEAGTGLAQFTNSNFASVGTNCTNMTTCNSVGGYPSPVMNARTTTNIPYWTLFKYGNLQACLAAVPAPSNLCSSVVTFFGNEVRDLYTGASILNPRMTTYSLLDIDLMTQGMEPVFSLNHFNYDLQAQILIPKAVDYSSGLLTYFFRGALAAQVSNGAITITNNSSDNMDGTFLLSYEDAQGHRSPVANWDLSIGAGETSSPQDLTLQSDPASHYILVFKGTLGQESGAVAGSALATDQFTAASMGSGTGTITSDSGGIDCGDSANICSGAFPTGSSVHLTAVADQGSTFTEWTGDCTGTANPITVTITSDMTCTAYFAPGISVALNPYGNLNLSAAPGSYLVQAVNPAAVATAIQAPASITVTINRYAPTCTITFNTTSTVVINQAQTSTSVPNAFAVARNAACPNTPVTTTWTIVNAVIAPNNPP